MVQLMVQRISILAAHGVLVLVENPLLSFLWLMREMLGLAGQPHWRLVRTDHCRFGTSYQKPQLWLTNGPGLEVVGLVCNHPRPYAERLEGSRTRRSQPYPLPLAAALVEAIAAGLARVVPAALPHWRV